MAWNQSAEFIKPRHDFRHLLLQLHGIVHVHLIQKIASFRTESPLRRDVADALSHGVVGGGVVDAVLMHPK